MSYGTENHMFCCDLRNNPSPYHFLDPMRDGLFQGEGSDQLLAKILGADETGGLSETA
jgi:hypothetical protein